MTTRIPNGTEVQWRGPRCARGKMYCGAVLSFLPKGESLIMWENRQHAESLEHLSWASPTWVDKARIDRYIVQTPDGCRTVSARTLEKAHANQG